MTTLVPVDGSRSSEEALKYAARRSPDGELLLLHVAPSGREADLARGRFLLEASRRTCQVIARHLHIQLRLEVGDPRAKLNEVVVDADCDLVVMGAHGVNATPQLERVGAETCEITEGIGQPVVLVLPTGKGIRAGSQNLDAEWDELEELAGSAA